jgi:hypothetical protein
MGSGCDSIGGWNTDEEDEPPVLTIDEFAARKNDPAFAVDWKARNAENPDGWLPAR